VAAPRTARPTTSCACWRSARPSVGDGCDEEGKTRAQQRAAGAKNTALFDIVNRKARRRFWRACAEAASAVRRAVLILRAPVAELAARTAAACARLEGWGGLWLAGVTAARVLRDTARADYVCAARSSARGRESKACCPTSFPGFASPRRRAPYAEPSSS
jgi:hypothetical protein